MSELKFTDEEYNKLKEVKQTYQRKFVELGEITLAKIDLEDKLSKLKEIEGSIITDLRETNKTWENLNTELFNKYGDGVYDQDKNIFKPLNK